jgi:hypothetical protein
METQTEGKEGQEGKRAYTSSKKVALDEISALLKMAGLPGEIRAKMETLKTRLETVGETATLEEQIAGLKPYQEGVTEVSVRLFLTKEALRQILGSDRTNLSTVEKLHIALKRAIFGKFGIRA